MGRMNANHSADLVRALSNSSRIPAFSGSSTLTSGSGKAAEQALHSRSNEGPTKKGRLR
jgi:hypothetical protein